MKSGRCSADTILRMEAVCNGSLCEYIGQSFPFSFFLSLYDQGAPVFVTLFSTTCRYVFEWQTPLACIKYGFGLFNKYFYPVYVIFGLAQSTLFKHFLMDICSNAPNSPASSSSITATHTSVTTIHTTTHISTWTPSTTTTSTSSATLLTRPHTDIHSTSDSNGASLIKSVLLATLSLLLIVAIAVLVVVMRARYCCFHINIDVSLL